MMWNFLQIRGLKDGIWFVSALFVAYLFFYFYTYMYEKNKNDRKYIVSYVVLSIVLIGLYYLYMRFVPSNVFIWKSKNLPWHLEYVPYALGFMFIGYYAKDNFAKVSDMIANKISMLILFLIYIVMIFLVRPVVGQVHWCLSILLEIVNSIIGIAALVSFCKNIKPNRYILFIGMNTLSYFGMNGKILGTLEGVISYIFKPIEFYLTNSIVFSIVYSFVFVTVLSIILIVPTIIINRYFPFIIGKSYKVRG